uniref:Protein disulfide-isomerase n=1 Tax=Rhizophora mucronata TaxID=61149 RepID=A0A2P2L943_RHIMU
MILHIPQMRSKLFYLRVNVSFLENAEWLSADCLTVIGFSYNIPDVSTHLISFFILT